MWDLRLPSGIFFLLLGILLCLMSFFYRAGGAPMLDYNVNLYSGLSMLIFGGVLLWLSKRSA